MMQGRRRRNQAAPGGVGCLASKEDYERLFKTRGVQLLWEAYKSVPKGEPLTLEGDEAHALPRSPLTRLPHNSARTPHS